MVAEIPARRDWLQEKSLKIGRRRPEHLESNFFRGSSTKEDLLQRNMDGRKMKAKR
jgi:hypothetical protein